jgi:hypothetical protein
MITVTIDMHGLYVSFPDHGCSKVKIGDLWIDRRFPALATFTFLPALTLA